eukprot:4201070-Pleurochrysis_carterae.AAC.1
MSEEPLKMPARRKKCMLQLRAWSAEASVCILRGQWANGINPPASIAANGINVAKNVWGGSSCCKQVWQKSRFKRLGARKLQTKYVVILDSITCFESCTSCSGPGRRLPRSSEKCVGVQMKPGITSPSAPEVEIWPFLQRSLAKIGLVLAAPRRLLCSATE